VNVSPAAGKRQSKGGKIARVADKGEDTSIGAALRAKRAEEACGWQGLLFLLPITRNACNCLGHRGYAEMVKLLNPAHRSKGVK
jgi:hypothetical protein